MRRRMMLVAAVVLAGSVAVAPRTASAEGLFDFLFGGASETAATPALAAGEFLRRSVRPQRSSPRRSAARGRLGRLRTGLLRPQLRRPVFPAGARQRNAGSDVPGVLPGQPTKVFFGSNIDGASSGNGERYADSENAFGYRKALRADCTCNGRDPAGLAPVDLSLDTSLRPGDVIATSSGLVAYSGVRAGNGQTAEFTPVASYPGLTAEVRARLGEMKVAPVSAETVAERRQAARCRDCRRSPAPKAASAKAKRADAELIEASAP